MHALVRDLRYAMRVLAANRGFAATAVFVLALGIAANVLIFSVVDAVLLRGFPFPESDRIVMLFESNLERQSRESIAGANFVDWRDQSQSFESIAAFEGQEYGHGPCRLAAGRAAPHFIAALESAPVNTVCDRRFHLQRPALPHSKARWVKAATPGRGGWPPRICPSNIVEHALCLDDMAKNSAKIALLGR